MASTRAKAPPLLSIGGLSRETGISTETLRMWERRYGAPRSQRLPSGHRRYPMDEARRIQLVVQVLRAGGKPRLVVAAPTEELLRMLGQAQGQQPNAIEQSINDERRSTDVAEALKPWFEAAIHMDGTLLQQSLDRDWQQMNPMQFLEERFIPGIEAVGDAWENGRLTVSQEHFISLQIADFLSEQWRRLAQHATKSPFLLATLPGELHHLGMIMCALVTAITGHRVIFLGPHTPPEELEETANEHQPSAVVVSFSKTAEPRAAQRWVRELREGIVAQTVLVIGGAGAPPPIIDGVTLLNTVREFHDWASEKP